MLRDRNTATVDDDTLLERPLSARSLVASLLLRTRPPRMRAARLVQWCGLFGVAEGTTRVALSRMVERGELRSRAGMYELAGRVQGRGTAQDWSLEPELAPWKGEWRFAIVGAGSRDAAARTALRDEMRRLRYAELREGAWTRPDNLPRASAPAESWKIVDAQCSWWSAQPDPATDPVALAAELFDGARFSARADMLTRRLTAATRSLGAADEGSLAEGFVTGAAALAHIRVDPLLPAELTAHAASGAQLRTAYAAYEGAFSAALHAWFLDH